MFSYLLKKCQNQQNTSPAREDAVFYPVFQCHVRIRKADLYHVVAMAVTARVPDLPYPRFNFFQIRHFARLILVIPLFSLSTLTIFPIFVSLTFIMFCASQRVYYKCIPSIFKGTACVLVLEKTQTVLPAFFYIFFSQNMQIYDTNPLLFYAPTILVYLALLLYFSFITSSSFLCCCRAVFSVPPPSLQTTLPYSGRSGRRKSWSPCQGRQSLPYPRQTV